MRQARTRCNQCSQEYRDKQTGWTYHSTYRVFTCSKKCSDTRLKTIEELDTIKKKEMRVFDHFWSLEEQQTILGLLKGRTKKRKRKNDE